MDRAEALRSIRHEMLEYIQRKVNVDFDNRRQAPVSFTLDGREHAVSEVLGRFKTGDSQHTNAYLVYSTTNDVFFIYFQWIDKSSSRRLSRGFWVLSFRILNDRELMSFYREERRIALDPPLERVSNFHGRVCPDLVVGAKFCECLQKILGTINHCGSTMTIISENCTPAVDAIQSLLGTTVGNARLKIMDFGKHSYTVLFHQSPHVLRFVFKRDSLCHEKEYDEIRGRVESGRAVLDEAVRYQELMDSRVRRLMEITVEDLFLVERVRKYEYMGKALN